MRKNIIVIVLLTVELCVHAINAKRSWITVTQRDGSEVELMMYGNENFHYFMTKDGLPVLQNSNDSNYYYANASGFGMTVTTQLAHNPDSRSMSEKAFAKELSTTTDLSVVTNISIRKKNTTKRDISSYTGHKKGIVILTQFSDKKFSISQNPKLFYNNILNGENYSSGNFVGSVYDYFCAQSSGLFNLTFDVVGPITLPSPISYYGSNDSSGDDIRPGLMTAQACMMVADSVNFSDYDWDGDGVVDQVFIEYAGYGEADGGGSSTIWPHEWELSSSDYTKSLTIDGVTVDTYACANELMYGTKTPTSSGIGTFCHEFSHCLGFPDFYDTGSNSNFGMDQWDLMDYGCYNGNGFCPAGYTSYEKWFCGWQAPIELSSACNIDNIKPFSEGGSSYIIYNDNDKNEYFLLENRQRLNWDASLSGSGLLILHVDYDTDSWTNNTVNTISSHQRMTIFHADNSASSSLTSIAGDPYPYGAKDSLTDKSIPAAKLYNNNIAGTKYMDKPITDIVQNSDGTISLKFMGGNISASIVENVESYDSLVGKSVDIYDLNGRVVLRTNDFRGIDPIPSGVYILRVINGKTFKISKK
jgi:immune inhibitor A